MKNILISSILTFLFIPAVSFAQTLPARITCTPESPLVLTQVFCYASGPSGSEKARFTWWIDNEKQLSGIGFKNFSFRSGPKSNTYNVDVAIELPDMRIAVGNAKVITRGFGDRIEDLRFRVVGERMKNGLELHISPSYPKAFEMVKASVTVTKPESAVEEFKNGKIIPKWKVGTAEPVATQEFSFRLGSTVREIPLSVDAGTFGTINVVLKPAGSNFVPSYDNAARAALCTARALDMLDANIGRAEREFDDLEKKVQALTLQFTADIEYLSQLPQIFLQEFAHDAEVITAITGMDCKPVMSCVRLGIRAASLAIKAVVAVYTEGGSVQTIRRAEEAVTNITTIVSKLENLVLSKLHILDNMVAQMERQKKSCEKAYSKVNTHGI